MRDHKQTCGRREKKVWEIMAKIRSTDRSESRLLKVCAYNFYLISEPDSF